MRISLLMLPIALLTPIFAGAQAQQAPVSAGQPYGLIGLLFFVLAAVLVTALLLSVKTRAVMDAARKKQKENADQRFSGYIRNFDAEQIDSLLKYKRGISAKQKKSGASRTASLQLALLMGLTLFGPSVFAQGGSPGTNSSLLSEKGIIITVMLLLIPILVGIALMVIKVKNVLREYRNRKNLEEARQLAEYIESMPEGEGLAALEKRKEALEFSLSHDELSGTLAPEDTKGMVNNVDTNAPPPVVQRKKRAVKRPNIDPALARLVLWYFGCATFWLLFGTTVGEYVGIKFVAPDADHISWLSFGRLRPVHTNAVFWGWASLAMLGLGYYTVPMVSNAPLASIKRGWWALWLINAAVILGSVCLMSGINNGGGEYREYIWPVMLLFGIGLVLTLINFLQTIGRRTTREIYISNWYIVSAVIFALVISVVAYVPIWQDGLGETIVQGYYMHQGVGMWFMLFTLGIVYYFLPQQLNQPIYSYSLGILAFWTQILFYTLIGTHHFIFSSIPWWLQTVAIVGSLGMAIPVIAGTTNFVMTFRGAWYKMGGSYTLPFFLVGIVFYFTGSMQGTAEAFRSTNLIWHFTDFTVAHSHLTMYGIICFFVWAGIYAVVPRLSGKEPPQITVGAHFWLALVGLLFYTVPLMYGATLKGMMWLQGKPFIDGVVFMAPYWLWRAIGGSLMWLSHLFFAYNLYKMLAPENIVDVKEAAFKKLEGDAAGVNAVS